LNIGDVPIVTLRCQSLIGLSLVFQQQLAAMQSAIANHDERMSKASGEMVITMPPEKDCQNGRGRRAETALIKKTTFWTTQN